LLLCEFTIGSDTMRVDRILCPVDFSEFSATAYEYAYSLSRQYKAKLFVLHVMEPVVSVYRGILVPSLVEEIYSRQDSDAREQIRKLESTYAGKGVASEVVIQVGLVADSILSFVKARDVDLVVVGTHGRRGLDRLMMGSVAERVLRRATCPVLAVRERVSTFVSPGSVHEPVRLQKLLCCVDFSETSPRALEYAFSLALQYQAEITLLHVVEKSELHADEQNQALSCIEDLIPVEARNWATLVPVVRAGKPYERIIEHATQAHTDLIVMGVRGRNALDLALFGSTTHRVIQLGPCPVLVVNA
jgi:nucleotide-binding universal stress UspA family protein